MDNVLAIDQGTHASRALVLDGSGRVLAQRQVPVALSHPQPGHVEQDAGEILASVQHCIAGVLDELTTRQRDAIRCCGITTQRSTVLTWQPDGTPVSPAINWQDTRGAPQIEILQRHAGSVRRISGLPLSPHFGASKLHYLHQLHPDPELRLGPLAAFLVHRLCDNATFAVDHGNAQRMQLFDIHARGWSQSLCEWFAVPRQKLPACRPICADYGILGDTGIPVTALGGDQNAAWFGAGNPDAGSVLVNFGSGAFVMATQPVVDNVHGLLSTIVYSDAARCDYVAEGTVNGAGNALQWLQSEYAVPDIEAQPANRLQQVAEPPLFLNTVGELGSPWWQRGLQPRFVAEASELSDAERVAGVTESIVFLVQRNLECLQQQGSVRVLRVSGGLSRLDALCQKLANLSDCKVQRANQHEASASGIAWLAAGSPAHWCSPLASQHFAPVADTALKARYQRFLEQLQNYIDTGTHD